MSAVEQRPEDMESAAGCHSRAAGMARINHWIPASAGMTEGWNRDFFGNGKGTVRVATCLFSPRRHSGEGRNPRLQDVGGRAASGTSGRGGRGRDVRRIKVSCRPSCHSRAAGIARINHWIPAFAGMTEGWSRDFFGNSKGAVRIATRLFLSSSSFRRKPESSGFNNPFPPWAGMPTQTRQTERSIR